MKPLSINCNSNFYRKFITGSLQKRKWLGHLFNFFLIILIALLFSFTLEKENFNGGIASGEWILDKTVSNVEFYYMSTECKGKKTVFLKFVNKNSYKVKVSWNEIFSTQMEKNINGKAGRKQIVLSGSETAENNCNTIKFKEGRIFAEDVRPTYVAEILSFEFSKIIIQKSN